MFNISLDTIEKAVAFAQELGLVPPSVGLAVDEAATISTKVIAALQKAGAITDEQSADADLKQLIVDLFVPKQEAQDAIDGKDDDPKIG